jgi:hypothetical protein
VLPNHSQIKERYLPPIKKFYNQHRDDKKYNWSAASVSNMKTSFRIDNNAFFDADFCNQVIYSSLDEFMKIHPFYSNKNIKSRVQDIWWNCYNHGDCVDFHSHGLPTSISGLYILESSEKNPTTFVSSNGFYDNELHRTDYAVEGSILLFPSSLRHYVPMVQNERTTVSFNIKLHIE